MEANEAATREKDWFGSLYSKSRDAERLLFKEFRAGDMILVDAEPDPDTGERIIVFRATPGFEPPTMELAESSTTD